MLHLLPNAQSVKILITVILLSNQGAMAKASGADPQWLSAPHSQIMVSQAGWP